MRKIVAALSTVVMLAAVTAVAQEKPKSGHEGMAKASGAKPKRVAIQSKNGSGA